MQSEKMFSISQNHMSFAARNWGFISTIITLNAPFRSLRSTFSNSAVQDGDKETEVDVCNHQLHKEK